MHGCARFGRHLQLEDPVFVSGCDVSLGLLVRHLDARRTRGVWFAASNLDALSDLSAGRTHVAAIHGLRSGAEEGRCAVLRRFDLAKIEEGWLVACGNARSFRGARNLTGGDIRLASRPPGAGARSLLDAELRRAAIDPGRVPGYKRPLAGHLDIARAVAAGFADVGVGIASAARLFGLAVYPIAVVKGSSNPGLAAKFVAYVLSPAGQAILRERGFLAPPTPIEPFAPTPVR